MSFLILVFYVFYHNGIKVEIMFICAFVYMYNCLFVLIITMY